jgi:SAM-dependent methyltransferase
MSKSETPWWGTYFDDAYLTEFEPLFDEARTRAEVARLLDVLQLPSDARILDCPCGQGRHARLLAQAGYDVTGVDFSQPLLRVARAAGRTRGLRYLRGDMRALPAEWKGSYDAVLNLFTSFGFFDDPADDERVIHEAARVLAPGGRFVWYGGSRDGVMANWVGRDAWTTADGTRVTHHRSFDPASGRISIRTTWVRRGQAQRERTHSIRLYTANRLAELCDAAGLTVDAIHDGLTERPLRRTSAEMLLVATRRRGGARRGGR